MGFIVGGAGARNILVRGIGPTLLTNFGLTDVLGDPQLVLYRMSDGARIDGNDNWEQSANAAQLANVFAQVGAFALPAGSKDAALLSDLTTGSYTVHVVGANAATGIALVETYDAGGGADAHLIGVSARSQVGTGADVLIAGFSVGEGSRNVLVRGIGPRLADFNVDGVLADPVLRLYRGNQLLAENDNWSVSSNADQLAAVAAEVYDFKLNPGSRDAVILATLPPGLYSAIVVGRNDTTGVALVEIYQVP